jgi:aspartate ammonia-lyase
VQAGSSIMPGKVNPVIPEMVNQVAYQVIGADLTVTMAAEAGQLQLNAMEPIAVLNILQSMRLLVRAIDVLTHKCVVGITANEARCRALLDRSLVLATALAPHLGYDLAARVAKAAMEADSSILEAAEALGITDSAALNAVRDPQAMLG